MRALALPAYPAQLVSMSSGALVAVQHARRAHGGVGGLIRRTGPPALMPWAAIGRVVVALGTVVAQSLLQA